MVNRQILHQSPISLKTTDVASLRLPHETATLQAAPTYKEIIVQSETLLDRQLRETYRCSKDLKHVNVSALRWYAYSLESWVSLSAIRDQNFKLISIESGSGKCRIRLYNL
jgi:hypothetical protein